MPAHFISDLVGTLSTYFRIASLRLKNNSNVLEVKDQADSAYLPAAVDELRLQGSMSGATAIRAAAAAAETYTLPAADGSSGDVLSTDGAGVLSWATIATSAGQVNKKTVEVNFGDGSPISVLTPPANAMVERVIVNVNTAFDATAPSLSVGIAGTVSKYMTTGENQLGAVAVYEVAPMYQEDGTPDAIIITFAPGAGGAAGHAYVSVEYANPT